MARSPAASIAVGAVDHVARPNQVVAALVFVADRFSPGNGERGDKGAGIRLVFVSAQQIKAGAIQVASIARDLLQRQDVRARSRPLFPVPLAVLGERSAQRLQKSVETAWCWLLPNASPKVNSRVPVKSNSPVSAMLPSGA